MSLKATDYIESLGLEPHPEGGWFKEVYRSAGSFSPSGMNGQRSFCTSIFFLLEKGNFSALHRIASDEIWHFYDGDPLEVIEIDPEGKITTTVLGQRPDQGEKRVYVVPAGNWFGSRPANGSEFSLVGCTVSPGFDFADFEMPDQNWFLNHYPQHSSTILQLTR